MKAYDFEYDGDNLSNKGFIICKFGTQGIQTISNGSYITFNTVSTEHGQKHELTSVEYEECLGTTFQICKHPCIGDAEEVSVSEIREIMRWLNRKEFRKFKLLSPDYMDIYWESTFNVSKIEIEGKVYGFELTVITNRPFALKETVEVNITNLQDNGKKVVSSLSDEIGYIYPKMKIVIDKSGDLEIHNGLENRTMRIANCVEGEIITINYPMIETSEISHKIQNDFNWNFFRLANTFVERRNELLISIPCTIKMTYNPIVKLSI